MKKSFVLFLFVVNACCVYADDLDDVLRPELHNQKPKLFLKKKFFDDVEKYSTVNGAGRGLATGTNTVVSFAAFLLVSLIGVSVADEHFELQRGSNRFFERRNNGPYRPLNVPQWTILKIFSSVASFGGGFIASKVIYKLFDSIINRLMPEKDYEEGSYKVLEEFLINWEKYKAYTPEKLHPFFDKLYDYYEQHCVLDEIETNEIEEHEAETGEATEIEDDFEDDDYWGNVDEGIGIDDFGAEEEKPNELKEAAYEIIQYVRAVINDEQPEEPVLEEKPQEAEPPENRGPCCEGLPIDELRGDNFH